MAEPWMVDELAHAGADHLDAAAVAGYDRKQGSVPDDAAAADLDLLRAHGIGVQATVVDLGAGTGRFVATVAPHVARTVAVDVSPAMLTRLRERLTAAALTDRVEVVRAGLLGYEHVGAPADVVHTRNTLHQLPDAFKVLALHRAAGMLRPGGLLRLHDLVYDVTPDRFASLLRAWFDGAAADAAEGYTADDLAEHVRSEHSTFTWLLEPMLGAAGFQVVDRQVRRGVYTSYLCRREDRPSDEDAA
jgi:SAM-dependent methyltransferase